MGALSALLVLLGVFLLIASWGMMIVTANKEDYTWGLCAVLLPPLAYFYGLFELDKTKDSWLIAILGVVLLGLSTSV